MPALPSWFDVLRQLHAPRRRINQGDIVRLRGGWCHMLVVDIDYYQPVAVCSWKVHPQGRPCEAVFETSILELIEPSKERR